MPEQSPVCVIGDVHGQREKLIRLLLEAKLIDRGCAWTGGSSRLWFLGDFVDRGAAAVDVVDLVMSLQRQASEYGGNVGALIGNHEVHLLSAHRFLNSGPVGKVFLQNWLSNGGKMSDLERLTGEHVHWLNGLPAMVGVGDDLLLHADSNFYVRYGGDIPTINLAVRAVLQCDVPAWWERLMTGFSGRHVFDRTKPGGAGRAERFLRQFGCRRLIHGHTPIDRVAGMKPEAVHEPFVYAKGLCVNIDGGMYRGGPGFIFRIIGDEARESEKEAVRS